MLTNLHHINTVSTFPRVLVAPLDWGLGHATRCIPIISQLQQQQTEVIVVADGKGAKILSEAFPGISIIPLKGYRIRYSGKKGFFSFKILLQIPKILYAISYERKWLEGAIEKYQIDAVISDNRYGLYCKNIPCVFITHQLLIKTGFRFFDFLLQKLNYRYINRFQECWVPDEEGPHNLAGELSHPKIRPSVPVKYLGVLSRFLKAPQPIQNDVAIVLSGPEPQRSIFENIILSQLNGFEKRIVLVRGLPDQAASLKNNQFNLTIYNHLSKEGLSKIIQESELVIARSGYSTVMDLVAIQKKSVLVPTPGQTEQEYLATYLSEKRTCISVSQDQFNLREALRLSNSFDYCIPLITERKETVITEWTKKLKQDL